MSRSFQPAWAVAFALAALVGGGSASAELSPGAKAPPFSTRAALAGKQTSFSLSQALARGPVVVYFFPKAFTRGCTLEANAFAEAIDEFKAAGASVIGLSADDIETLKRFSLEECREAFPVGVATREIIRAYDVALERDGLESGLASRTSYVIAPDGRIVFVHESPDYRDHVRLTLEAVRSLARVRR